LVVAVEVGDGNRPSETAIRRVAAEDDPVLGTQRRERRKSEVSLNERSRIGAVAAGVVGTKGSEESTGDDLDSRAPTGLVVELVVTENEIGDAVAREISFSTREHAPGPSYSEIETRGSRSVERGRAVLPFSVRRNDDVRLWTRVASAAPPNRVIAERDNRPGGSPLVRRGERDLVAPVAIHVSDRTDGIAPRAAPGSSGRGIRE
jgi:hypothetical protein